MGVVSPLCGGSKRVHNLIRTHITKLRVAYKEKKNNMKQQKHNQCVTKLIFRV